jgi:hypothetical protein
VRLFIACYFWRDLSGASAHDFKIAPRNFLPGEIMKLPTLRAQDWLVFAVVAGLFFAWGAWLMRPQPPAEPLEWIDEWQQRVLQPLADDRLSLAQLTDPEGGELWLQANLDGARLLYRSQLAENDEQGWSVEAEVALTGAERVSLLAAAGMKLGDGEQPLSNHLLMALGSHGILSLTLLPPEPMDAARLAASVGQPRLTLELAEGQAWVYPELGMTAHLQDEELYFLYVVPRHLLKQR